MVVLNILKLRKVLDVLPLCHRFVYESWTVVEGQGYFFIWGFTSLSTLYRSYHNG